MARSGSSSTDLERNTDGDASETPVLRVRVGAPPSVFFLELPKNEVVGESCQHHWPCAVEVVQDGRHLLGPDRALPGVVLRPRQRHCSLSVDCNRLVDWVPVLELRVPAMSS